VVTIGTSFSTADTFKHKDSGETFTGFATQKVAAGKTLVYNHDASKMMPVLLSEYEITSDAQGRRNTVSLLLLNESDVFISETVSQKAAALIIDASNKGPQAIILQIDSPGGRGNSMNIIADAILKTENCPVVAYISKGAYSAAAVVALACDAVYINSTAGIGAIGSATDRRYRDLDYADYLSIYSFDFELNDYLYTKVLAQKSGRPELLVQALIDKGVSVVEVANIDGSRSFIESKNRQATQTLTRTLCEGLSETELENISPADIAGKVLNLSAKEAAELKLVDATAESVPDILAEMQLSDAKITPVPGIEKVAKKFASARRNIADGIFLIEQYEQDIQTLSDQFSAIDSQLRTGTETRETSRGDYAYRSNRRRSYSSYDQINDGIARSGRRKVNDRDTLPRSQTITTEEPRVNIQNVYGQLTRSLEDVVVEYRRVLNLVDRWPNGLPPKVSRTMLQKDMDSASAELDRLYRYQPVYPTENRSEVRQRRSTDRRSY
jgi:hypothetical protein